MKDAPIRQKSIHGQRASSPFLRECVVCGTGHEFANHREARGLWRDSKWWCSQECWDRK